MNEEQVVELLIQSLAHERGGIKVYEAALRCARDSGLRKEWSKYLDETRRHEQVLLEITQKLGIDPERQSAGREVVTMLGNALVRAMQQARESGDPAAAQLVACECVVLAETKDHANWDLLSRVCEHATGPLRDALHPSVQEVEDQEDEHLYHSRGWCRELWRKSLGLSAILPPPEEQKHVTTEIGAARAKSISDAH
jgi:rubrerythrin